MKSEIKPGDLSRGVRHLLVDPAAMLNESWDLTLEDKDNSFLEGKQEPKMYLLLKN